MSSHATDLSVYAKSSSMLCYFDVICVFCLLVVLVRSYHLPLSDSEESLFTVKRRRELGFCVVFAVQSCRGSDTGRSADSGHGHVGDWSHADGKEKSNRQETADC